MAALPIKAEDACVGLQLDFMQIITGSKDVEGRQVCGVTERYSYCSYYCKLGHFDNSVDAVPIVRISSRKAVASLL